MILKMGTRATDPGRGHEMTIRQADVVVKRIPVISSVKQKRSFLREIQRSVDLDRPRVVLDCSNVHCLDKLVLSLILCCLEEAMKRHGDVRLAALPDDTRTLLEMSGAGRLFEIYDTTREAVDGFRQLPVESVLQPSLAAGSEEESGNAA